MEATAYHRHRHQNRHRLLQNRHHQNLNHLCQNHYDRSGSRRWAYSHTMRQLERGKSPLREFHTNYRNHRYRSWSECIAGTVYRDHKPYQSPGK
jgi:hypothetical protein